MGRDLLVTGASGKLGQRVIEHLLSSNKVAPGRIAAATRQPEKLAALAAKGVEVRRLDFEDPKSLSAAFTGIKRLLVISTDAIDRPGRRLAQHQAAVSAARTAAVKHIVYTSMPKPEESLVLFAPDHRGTEQAIAESGLSFTILRMNWYMDNLLASLGPALASGKWYTSTAGGRVGYVAREDCARAAAAALGASSTGTDRLDVTGPASVSVDDIAAQVRAVTGKALAVVQLGEEEYRQHLTAGKLPPPIVALLMSIEASIRTGKLDVVANTVQRLTGTAPQGLKEFLTQHKSALVAA